MMIGIYGLIFEFMQPGAMRARRDRRDRLLLGAVRAAPAAGQLRRASACCCSASR